MSIPFPKHLTVLADLVGEDMLNFRNGKDLYPYCPGCEYSSYTPVTKVLGCTKGDDPEVTEFSNEVEQDPDIVDTQKCPGYVPRSRDGDMGFQDEAAVAAFEKEIPTRTMPSSVEKWQELVHDTVDDLKENPETAEQGVTLERGLQALNWDEHASQEAGPIDYPQYNLFDHEKEGAVEGDQPTVQEGLDDDELYSQLTQAGLGESTSIDQQRKIVTEVLLHWKNGLLADRLTNDLVDQIINEYNQRG